MKGFADEVKDFTIDKETGNLRIDGKEIRSGFVTVTHQQAKEARNHWDEFGIILGKPDHVVITRTTKRQWWRYQKE